MAINVINPNYNLINKGRIGGAEQVGSLSGPGSGSSANDAADGVNFSDVLDTVISNTVQQNKSSGTPGGTINLDTIFQKASDAFHVPVGLLKAVARAESNFDPMAESHAGAQGIMQLMPGTAKALGVTNAFDPVQNIMGGAKYLSQQLERYGGDTVLALAAYNAGPGNVAKYNGVPPFEETRNYITKVMGYAGESITVGDAAVSALASVPDSEGVLGNGGLGLLNTIIGDLDVKDYAMLMDLYRYRMQMNVLTDSGSEPESDSFFI